MWRENGFEIVGQAITQRSAVSYIKSNLTELVVCFEKPPELDAIKVAENFASIGNIPALIVISPDGSSERIRQCFLKGAVDYLTEPVSMNALAGSLQTALKKIKSSIGSTEYHIAVEEYFAGLEEKIRNETLKKIKAFIEDNEHTVVSTQTAAEYFGFNKDYFGRLFRSETGMTFGEFYKRFRMVYAERLLRTGRYRVHEVSEILGFATADYFTSEFKKYTGMKPLEVRKQDKT